MSPREIAEKLHDHYCVQECRWHDKPGRILAGEAEITEAIDAATKPLREEIEALREQVKRYNLLRLAVNENDSDCLPTCGSMAHAEECPRMTMAATLEKQQARLKALVEALRAAGEAIHSEYCGERHHSECQKVDAALASSEPKESLPKASEGA